MVDEEFKKKFPKLAEEMEKGVSKADVEFTVEEPAPSRKNAGFDPSAIDFIRRCKTDDQAYEIIEYLVKRGEVSKEEAENMCSQLKESGVRSFGPLKKAGHYNQRR
jgi:hypothetical protein